MRLLRFALISAILFVAVAQTYAHPLPNRVYDRTVVVRLTSSAVVVDYQLDLDEFTAERDLLALRDKTNLADLTTRQSVRDAFAGGYAPILADNLAAELDDEPLTFECTKWQHSMEEGHLRCHFTFRADWKPRRDSEGRFKFREGNFELDAGMLRLSLTADDSVEISKRVEPSEAVKGRSPADRKPGDEDRLRNLSATFRLADGQPKAEMASAAEPDSPASSSELIDLRDLVRNPERGFWLLMALAAVFGAAHALTPGHGKTLVAAYLVGERGTVWHALFLGLVTTLTHTGAVLILAAVLPFFFPGAPPAQVQFILGLGGGLLVAGMGLWLLLRRLSGQADHIHIGGDGHHHHGHDHGAAAHYHDAHGRAHALPDAARYAGWWGLIVLGVSGGLVPCWDAILMFGFAVATQRLWLGLPLLLAFSAGLAGVLIIIGVLVVKAKGFAGSHWGESRLFRILPVASAVAVTCLGLWLCYTSARPG